MKTRLLSIVSSLLVLFFLLPGQALAWNPFGDACNTSTSAKASVACDANNQGQNTNPISGSNGIILKATNIIALGSSVVAVFVIMIGAFKYVTSSGDSGNVTSAKNTILFAVIGLVVIAVSRTLVIFVINKL